MCWLCLQFLHWGGAVSTYRVANSAKRLSELSDAFEQANFAVAAEESLNRKYRLQPSAEVLKRHHEAAASLLAALDRVRALDDSVDGVLISDVRGMHKEYLLAVDQMFAAVDAGDVARANGLIEPRSIPDLTRWRFGFLQLPTLIIPRLYSF